jgi:hypothetical protein
MRDELERASEQTRKRSGNRALGFVLISAGAFALLVGRLLFFLLWPVALLGAAVMLVGASLYLLEPGQPPERVD